MLKRPLRSANIRYALSALTIILVSFLSHNRLTPSQPLTLSFVSDVLVLILLEKP